MDFPAVRVSYPLTQIIVISRINWHSFDQFLCFLNSVSTGSSFGKFVGVIILMLFLKIIKFNYNKGNVKIMCEIICVDIFQCEQFLLEHTFSYEHVIHLMGISGFYHRLL